MLTTATTGLPSAARIRSNYAVVLAALVFAVAAIFIADTLTDYAVAVAIFHTAVMLVATRFLGVRAVAALAVACVVLTCLSFVLTPSGDYKIGLINTGISVVAIGVTAYLGLKLKGAEAQIHEARERIIDILQKLPTARITISHDWDFLARISTTYLTLAHGRLDACAPSFSHTHAHAHPLGDEPHAH